MLFSRPGWLVVSALFFLLLPAFSDSTRDKFREVVERTDSLRDCQVKFREYGERGAGQEKIYALRHIFALYLRNPRLYYQRILSAEYNYPEQAKPGYQEIYRGEEDIIECLLPGTLRLLGVVRFYPEDPKSRGMRSQGLKYLAPWDQLNELKARAEQGEIYLKIEERAGKKFYQFEIRQPPSQVYLLGVNRARLWVEQETLLPFRIEKFAPGKKEPVWWIEYEEFIPDAGIKPEQIKFQGIRSPFSALKFPAPEELDHLIYPLEKKVLKKSAPLPEQVFFQFQKALERVNSYQAELEVRFGYQRLRLWQKDRFACHKNPYWFTIITIAQKTSYPQLSYSAGSVVWLSPQDNCFHIIGGGIQRIIGEQVFSRADFKFYSPLGNNPYQLDFFSLEKILERDFLPSQARWVAYQGEEALELELKRTAPAPEPSFGRVCLLLNPTDYLPRAVELGDYDDPEGIMSMELSNLKLNPQIQPGQRDF